MHRLQDTGRNPRTTNSLIDSTCNKTETTLGDEQGHRVYRGRFAPSPTGDLHFGSLVAALACALQANLHGGSWQVRIDDIDPPREIDGASSAILKTLAAHAFEYSVPVVYQSEHTNRYRHAINKLAAQNLVYGCDCSRRQLADARKASSGCPGRCQQRSLSLDNHSVRFRATSIESFNDIVMGSQMQDVAAEIGDFVVRRKDGLYSYQLASVVDDGEDNITEIVRGADLLDNTPRQIALFKALGYTIPSFMHIPVAVDANNQKLSKQSKARVMPADDAKSNLLAAWVFLGQQSVAGEPGMNACDSLADFWIQARADWNPARIPTVRSRKVDPALC